MAKITVEAKIHPPIDRVWRAWNTPNDIKQWSATSPDGHATAARSICAWAAAFRRGWRPKMAVWILILPGHIRKLSLEN